MGTVLFFLIRDNSFLKRKEKQAKKTKLILSRVLRRENRRRRGKGRKERKMRGRRSRKKKYT